MSCLMPLPANLATVSAIPGTALWTEPLAHYAHQRGFICVRAQDPPDPFEDSILQVLSPREQAQWEVLRERAVRKRIADWQRGRRAAKQSIRTLVWETAGIALAPADVEIIPGQWGEPLVEGAWKKSLGLSPVVSISHSGGAAVALAAHGASVRVGIDLELAGRPAHGVREIVFEPAECALIDALDPALRQEWVLRLWCAKETAGKALGRGFSAGFKALNVTEFDLQEGVAKIELCGRLAGEFPAQRGLLAHTSTLDGFIVSTVVCPAAARG